jgi:hypothetical protein
MRNTVARGAEVELIVATKAVRDGFTVSMPISHNSEYDLVIDAGKLNRIQVKRAYRVNNHGKSVLCVETRRILVRHSGKRGSVAKRYSDDGYDFLIAHDCESGFSWVIPHEVAQQYKAQIYLETPRIERFKEQWTVLADTANQSSEMAA